MERDKKKTPTRRATDLIRTCVVRARRVLVSEITHKDQDLAGSGLQREQKRRSLTQLLAAPAHRNEPRVIDRA